MTTICYRNGTLAGDTRAYSGGRPPIGEKQKIWKVDYGDGRWSAFGTSTVVPGLAEQIKTWLQNEKSRDHEPKIPDAGFDTLEINEKGEVYFYSSSLHPTGPLTGEFFAVGSGQEFALGAMAMGASAVEAVQAAGQLDVWTGGHVNQIQLFPEDAEVIEEIAA